MKIFKTLGLLIVLAAAFFTSCEKDGTDGMAQNEPNDQNNAIEVNPLARNLTGSSDFINLDCIRIPYPVDFLQASGNTITVNNEDELEAATMLADSIVDFVYPFEVLDDNDVEITISEVGDLATALVTCASDPNPNPCDHTDAHVLLFYNAFNIFTINRYEFEVEFPFSLVVEGNTVVVNSEDEYLPAIGGNPSRFLDVEIVYPVTITQFGQEIVLNNDGDVCDFYNTLGEDCENKPAHIQFFYNEGSGTPINCAYFIEYPVEITLNGTTIEVQDRQQYRDILNASPNALNDVELVYPVSLFQFQDGDKFTFDADAEICDYLDNVCQY